MNIRTISISLALLVPGGWLLSQKPTVILDPTYPAELYIPFDDHGRAGFADTLGRLVVAATFDSTRMVSSRYKAGVEYQSAYRNGGYGVFLGAPARYFGGHYVGEAERHMLTIPLSNVYNYAYIFSSPKGRDYLLEDGDMIIEDAAEVIPIPRINFGLLVRRKAGDKLRLVGVYGQNLTDVGYESYVVDPEVPEAVPYDIAREVYPSKFALKVTDEVTHYIGYRGILIVDERDYATAEFVSGVALYERTDAAAAPRQRALRQGTPGGIEAQPPPPPAAPPPPPPRAPGNRYAAQPPVESIDTTHIVRGLSDSPDDLDAGYPDLERYRELVRQSLPSPPLPPATRDITPEEEAFRRESMIRERARIRRGQQAEYVIERSIAVYRKDSVERERTTLARLGVDSLGGVTGTRYFGGRGVPLLVRAYTNDGVTILDRSTSTLWPLRMDTIDVMLNNYLATAETASDERSRYYVVGVVDGRPSIRDERNRVILGDGYDSFAYNEQTGMVTTAKGDKRGIWIPNTTYPAIPARYDSIAFEEAVRVNAGWSFGLYRVTLGGKSGLVGENGVEFFDWD